MAGPSLSDLLLYRERLFDALGSGARVVQDQNGERVEYRSMADLRSAIAYVESEIAKLNTPAANLIKFNVSKGT